MRVTLDLDWTDIVKLYRNGPQGMRHIGYAFVDRITNQMVAKKYFDPEYGVLTDEQIGQIVESMKRMVEEEGAK